MKKIFLIVISVVLFFTAQSALAAPDLVVNGGFEEPIVGAPQNWDIFITPEVPGWVIEWMSTVPPTYLGRSRPEPQLELHRGVLGPAAEGEQYAELDTDWDGPGGGLNNEPASVKIYQDIVTTPGAKYELRFSFSPRPGRSASDNHLQVNWDGGLVADISEDGTANSSTAWSEYTYEVTASGSYTRIEFADLGTADSYGTFLDNINVTEIPKKGSDNNDNNVIITGDVVTSAETITIVNTNISRGCCDGEAEQANIGNIAVVKNVQIAISNTGFNGIANSFALGGESKAEGNDNNTIITGNTFSQTRAFTIANSNIKRDCCGTDQINVGNFASVKNLQVSVSNTGLNGIANAVSMFRI